MADRLSVDVLVVGSGASGLAAAVSADKAGARVALVTKGALQSCNSAKAQGGIQAAFGEDDPPQQHAEDLRQTSPARSCSQPGAGATARPRSGASSRRTIRERPVR